jgi:hypothetical protein
MHKTLTMLSLRAGNISSALWSNIFGTFVAEECKTSGDFNTSSLIVVLGLCLKMPYKNDNILSQI